MDTKFQDSVIRRLGDRFDWSKLLCKDVVYEWEGDTLWIHFDDERRSSKNAVREVIEYVKEDCGVNVTGDKNTGVNVTKYDISYQIDFVTL